MENASIVSKVLVIDDGDIDVLTEIKRFCQDNNIVALKTHSGVGADSKLSHCAD